MHRFTPIALLGGLLGCQAILGLDEGQKRPEGQGGTTSANSSSSATGASTGGVGGNGGQAAATGTGATAATGTGASSAAATGTGGTAATGTGGTAATGTGGAVAGTGGTTGSSSSSAGVGGSGGGLELDLIDDMEDTNGLIIPVNGRAGAWFTYNDGTGTQTPTAGAPVISELLLQPNPGIPGSTRAVHTTGSAFSNWGAGIGFDLNNMTMKQVYDVTAYTGVTFWGLGNSIVRFRVPIAGTVSTVDGGSCLTNCGDHHGKSITLTASWQQHFVSFSSLLQEGWGTGAAFDSATVLSIQLSVEKNVNFDFWLDDISFYK